MGYEIERKFTVERLPEPLSRFVCHEIEQGYLNERPAIRVRAERMIAAGAGTPAGERFYMTYKSAGRLSHEEYNLPLDEATYTHLLAKADGCILRKRRYLIPLNEDAFDEAFGCPRETLTIELDVFDAPYEGLVIAEVEFPDEETALAYRPADWFGQDVTGERRYSNAHLAMGKGAEG